MSRLTESTTGPTRALAMIATAATSGLGVAWIGHADHTWERILAGCLVVAIAGFAMYRIDLMRRDTVEVSGQEPGQFRKLSLFIAASFGVWILLFLVGVNVSSSQHLDVALANELPPLKRVEAASIFAVSHTYSNVALLCCVTVLLGSLLRGAVALKSAAVDDRVSWSEVSLTVKRGLVIYAVALSSVLLLSGGGHIFDSPDPYLRFSIFISGLGLLRGFKPTLFA